MVTRALWLALLMLAACSGGGSDNNPDGGGSGGSGGAGSGGTGAEGCVTDRITSENVDKVDLLFVVDNSESMIEEQASLRAQMPRLITTLTTGMRNDGTSFPAVRSLNLGVVSTDMGLPDVPNREALGCGTEARRHGDDGILQSAGNPAGEPGLSCDASYPPFLGFQLAGDPSTNQANATALANDIGCVATLGTSGCGFEMPLEAMLRALWPSDNTLPNGAAGVFADGRRFFDGTMFGMGAPAGPNTGFLRSNLNEGQSVIAVVVVTDEDDCSSHSMTHFVPNDFLQDGDPLRQVAMNRRCFNESVTAGSETARDSGEGNLYSIARFAEGLKALRAGTPRVIFAAITGVPNDLVAAVSEVDFTIPVERDAYYDRLLADPRLIETPDPNNGTDLIPSCLRTNADAVVQRSVPPRRLIKVAKIISENAVLGSICNEDFTPDMDRIIDAIARQVGPSCFRQTLVADSDNLVPCRMMWELPLPGEAPNGTPTSCADASAFLSAPPTGERQMSSAGRPLCVVNQVPVVACTGAPPCANGFQPNQLRDAVDSNGDPIAIDGWYYDDFSNDVASCPSADKQRIAFTSNPGVNVQPPIGVTVSLTCAEDDVSSCF